MTAVILASVPVSFVLRSGPSLFFKPLTEDGFYSLSVARNLALGHGLTIDGTHLTNGFQPLVTVVESLAFLPSSSRASGVRLVLLFSWLVLLATCVVVALIARDLATSPRARLLAPWLAVVALLSGRYVLYAFNGLETGAELLAVGLLWLLYQRRGVTSTGTALAMGAGLGALVLVRVDGIALVAVVCGAILLARRDATGVRWSLTVGLTALVVSLPWWLYNVVEFGHVLPTSGQAEQSIGLVRSRLGSLLIGAAQDVIPWGYSARTQTVAFSIVEVVVVAVVVWLYRTRVPVTYEDGGAESGRVERGWRFATLLAVSVALLALFYFIETNAVWFYGRYLAPAVVFSAVVGAVAVANRRWGGDVLVGGLATLALIIGVAFTFHFDTNATSPYYRNQLALIKNLVPASATVAAGQTGTIGFFRSHVVNLDGKVNAQALSHQGNIPLYLQELGVQWLCDQPDYIEKYLGSDTGTPHGWHLVMSLNGFQLWHHAPYGRRSPKLLLHYHAKKGPEEGRNLF